MRIKGIPFRIHSSWFAIFIFFAWTAQLEVSSSNDYQFSIWISWFIGFITSFLLFLSVLLHELGHSFMALHEGVKVRSITLFFLGGVAKVERECPTPMGTFRIALAGPLVSFFIAGTFLNSVQLFDVENVIISNLLNQLGSLNLVLGIFNLLPCLPLDGGVILKSLVWNVTGSQKKGIKVATASGRFFSLFAIFLGTWICLKGGGLSGLWLFVLGWLGFAASRSQNQMLVLQEALCDLKVENVYGRSYRVLEANWSLRRISETALDLNKGGKNHSDWLLVCREGRWIGYITEETLKDVPVQYWDNYLVGDYSTPLSQLPFVFQNEPLWKAISLLEKTKNGRLLVFNLAGLPVGTLDRIDAGEAVLKRIGLNIPYKFIEIARKKNTYPLGLSLSEVVEAMMTSGLAKKS
tara:strand:- start:6491 stop:7714 length:1224 start_codon:yes stop_codon:yes gene_type:complete